MSNGPSENYSNEGRSVPEAITSSDMSDNGNSSTVQNSLSRGNSDQLADMGVKRKVEVKNLQFPLETGDDFESYQRHYIRFYINIDEESRLVQDDIKNGTNLTTDKDNTNQNRFRTGQISEERFQNGAAIIAATAAMGSSSLQNIISGLSKKGNKKAATGAAILATGAAALTGAAVSKSFNVTKKLKRLAGSITLYAPGDIQTSYGISYDKTDNMLNELLKTGKGDEIEADKTLSKMTRIVGTNASKDVLGSLTRTAQNKKRDLLFDSVDNRNFTFSYNFMPKNAREAIEISDIIHTFIYHAHPETIQGYDQFLLLYPAEFDIEYIYKRGGEEIQNNFIRKISSCVLTNIDIQYGNGGSYQSLANGAPVNTRLSLRFTEIENLTKERIEDWL